MLLKYLPREIWTTTTLISNNEYVKANGLFKAMPFLPNHPFKGQRRLMLDANKPYSFLRLLKRDYDVFHQTHFETYCLKAIGSKPMVTTFHDINFSKYTPNPKIVAYQRKSLARADKVIAISEHTKRDLIDTFGINPDKVTVIYHGIELPPHNDDAPPFDFPYVLFVGAREKHKNFTLFAKAFAEFNRHFPDIHLVCTRGPFSTEEEVLLQGLGIREKSHVISADEVMMNRLYRHALMFVFPSLYEGFGMPILEAMANDCPVVLSDQSCFPEIARDSALYFDPRDIGDMSDKMIKVAESTDLRDSLIAKGAVRVQDFSWQTCADKHLRVYESLL